MWNQWVRKKIAHFPKTVIFWFVLKPFLNYVLTKSLKTISNPPYSLKWLIKLKRCGGKVHIWTSFTIHLTSLCFGSSMISPNKNPPFMNLDKYHTHTHTHTPHTHTHTHTHTHAHTHRSNLLVLFLFPLRSWEKKS